MGKIKERIQNYWRHKAKPFLSRVAKFLGRNALKYGKDKILPQLADAAKPIMNKAQGKVENIASGLTKQGVNTLTGIAQSVVDKIPSMAKGGMIVHAPAHVGKIVRLHKGELVIPAAKVKNVMRALRKAKVAVPIRRH